MFFVSLITFDKTHQETKKLLFLHTLFTMLPHVVVRTSTLCAVQHGDADTSVHAWVHVAWGTVVLCDIAHLLRCPHQVVHCLTVDDHLEKQTSFVERKQVTVVMRQTAEPLVKDHSDER